MTDDAKLSGLERVLLLRCLGGIDIKSSDREEDRARTRLKRQGFLVFERSYWRWRVTDTGKAELQKASAALPNSNPDVRT